MSDRPFYDPIFFPGRRVRIRGGGTRPPGVPLSSLEGVVLRVIPLDGHHLKIEVETGTGPSCDSRLYDKEDLELLSLDEETLKSDLIGRRVHFPRSSGIGISFPPRATDDGVIALVRFEKGQPRLVVHVDCEGTDVKFVTPCDFRQCDLVPCGKEEKKDP